MPRKIMWNKFKTWHRGLSRIGRVAFWTISTLVVVLAINGANSPQPQKSHLIELQRETDNSQAADTPTVIKKSSTETTEIPFSKTTIEDPNLAKGKTELRTAGVNGIRTLTYIVTYTDGAQTDKQLTKEEITTKPISEVTAIGTYVAPKADCDPNYSGACVPNVYPSDVDCAGGSGNGPYYVQGPVYVIGYDHYGLDRDHDGVACE